VLVPEGFCPKLTFPSTDHCSLLAQLAGAYGMLYVALQEITCVSGAVNDLLLLIIKKENAHV